ncbi:MAG: hypothetical protein ACXWVM_29540 [Polyangiales bacterium]
MHNTIAACFWLSFVLGIGCSSSTSPAPSGTDSSIDDTGAADGVASDATDAADATDASPDGDVADGAVDKTAPCVSTFGGAIGSVGFARFDGTVVAVLPPGNTTCTAPNKTHLVIELKLTGVVYRMVIDVSDTTAPGTIGHHTLTHDLLGGPWSDGWHAMPLDYTSAFGLHSADFPKEPTADAVAEITNALDLGAHVSIFATAQGEVDSAHLVHRVQKGTTASNTDGAIVVDVDGASPRWLLFSFSDYTF